MPLPIYQISDHYPITLKTRVVKFWHCWGTVKNTVHGWEFLNSQYIGLLCCIVFKYENYFYNRKKMLEKN